MSDLSPEIDRWAALRRLTSARIALGRAGGSLPTRALLSFAFDHAEAKDAVHAELDFDRLQNDLADIGLPILRVASRVVDRVEYLQRPGAGGQLDDRSRELLARSAAGRPQANDVAIIIADGLSATAAQLHGPTVARKLIELLTADGLSLAPTVLARYARVAIEDEIGQLLGARLAVILLGERPGLGTSDSLGAYLVFNPRSGNTNAMRNCVSNIRPAGLPPVAAAETLHYLIRESFHRQISGVELKDERGGSTLRSDEGIGCSQHVSLDDIIQRYLPPFRVASEQCRFSDSPKLLDMMKAEFNASPPEPREVIKHFEAIISGNEAPGSQFVFVAAWNNRSVEYCGPLCRILQLDRCQAFHESAVELLTEVGDAQAIPALEMSLEYRWDFDPWLCIPRKALQALQAIGTPDALALIKRAANSSVNEIRDEAQMLLCDAGSRKSE